MYYMYHIEKNIPFLLTEEPYQNNIQAGPDKINIQAGYFQVEVQV